MALKSFTSNFEDNSTDAGFQFTFFCDACREGYKTEFSEAKSYKKGRLSKGLGGFIGAATQMTGKFGNVGNGIGRGSDVLSEKLRGCPRNGIKSMKKKFLNLRKMKQWAISTGVRAARSISVTMIGTEKPGFVLRKRPGRSTEVAAARADKMVQDIKSKAGQTQVFTGKIEQRQTLCSKKCGKPAGEGNL